MRNRSNKQTFVVFFFLLPPPFFFSPVQGNEKAFLFLKVDGPEVPRQGQRARQYTQIEKRFDTHGRQGTETEHRKPPPQKMGRREGPWDHTHIC